MQVHTQHKKNSKVGKLRNLAAVTARDGLQKMTERAELAEKLGQSAAATASTELQQLRVRAETAEKGSAIAALAAL